MLSIYRAGTGSVLSESTNVKMITDCLNKMCTADVTSLVLGDLNCPGINWQDYIVIGDNNQQLFFETVRLRIFTITTQSLPEDQIYYI